jgi:hypothetical protein
MNRLVEQSLLEKLRALPPEQLAEVERFVDFLASRDRAQAFTDFLAVAREVESAGVAPLSATEIEVQIEQLRTERRRGDAGRP